MANNFSVNNFSMYNTGWSTSTTTGFTDKLFYDWKTFITAHGWTVVASGDGISNFSLSSDIFTSAYKGIANGFANPKSWFIIQEPSPGYASVRREFLVVKTNDSGGDQSRAIFYSQQGFNRGSATGNGHNSGANISATNPPYAYDEILVNGSYVGSSYYQQVYPANTYNVDVATAVPVNSGLVDATYWNTGIYNSGLNVAVASPPSAANYNSQYPSMYYNFFASDTAPYSWYIMTVSLDSNVGVRVQKFFMFDGILEYPTGHPDPVLLISLGSSMTTGNTYLNVTNITNEPTHISNAFTGAWESKTTFTSKADSLARTYTNNTQSFVEARLENPSNLGNTLLGTEGKYVDIVTPAMWYLNGTNKYHYGKSANMNVIYKQVPSLFTATIATTRDNICITYGNTTNKIGLLVPWDGSRVTY